MHPTWLCAAFFNCPRLRSHRDGEVVDARPARRVMLSVMPPASKANWLFSIFIYVPVSNDFARLKGAAKQRDPNKPGYYRCLPLN